MAAVAAMDSNPSQRSKNLKAIGDVVKFMVQFILSFPSSRRRPGPRFGAEPDTGLRRCDGVASHQNDQCATTDCGVTLRRTPSRPRCWSTNREPMA